MKQYQALLAFVHVLYTMACHDSHLSSCHLMPGLELESAIAAGIAMHRSAHSGRVNVDQHMIIAELDLHGRKRMACY